MRKRDGSLSLRFSFRVAFCMAFLVLLTFVFQNCISPEDGGKDRLSTKGNGEGYSGKVVYLHYDLNGGCSNGETVYAQIEVIEGKKYQVRDKCENVEPREIDTMDIDYLPHNRNSLVFDRRYYQLATEESRENLITEIFCRGQDIHLRSGHMQIVDVTIKRNETGYIGKINLGIYDEGSLIESRNTDFVQVDKLTVPDANLELPGPIPPPSELSAVEASSAEHWAGFMPRQGQMAEIFSLVVRGSETSLSASFSSILNPELGFDGSEHVMLDRMSCATHH